MKKEFNNPEFLQVFMNVRKDKRLKAVDGFVHGAIHWFINLKDGKCYASNDRIAKVVEAKPQTVQDSLNRLEKCGYIKRIFEDDRRLYRNEIKMMGIHLNTQGSSNEDPGGYSNEDQREKSPQVEKKGGDLENPSLSENESGNTTDGGEDTYLVDVDSDGMPVRKQPRKSKGKDKKHELIKRVEKMRNAPFGSQGKQLKYIKEMENAGYTLKQIGQRWAKLRTQEYWQSVDSEPDFKNVADSFDKQPNL